MSKLKYLRYSGLSLCAHLLFCCEETLHRTFHMRFLPNVNQFGQMVWEKIFSIDQDLPMAAILVVLSERNIKILYRISQTAFLQSKQFIVPQRRFLSISANQKNNAHCDHVFVQSGCFLVNCDLFGQAVSDKKFLEIDQSETRIVYGSHICKQIGTKWATL